MTDRDDCARPHCYRGQHGCAPAENRIDVDVSYLSCPDLSAIDVLARLYVIARHRGQSLWLHGATSELVEFFELVGLREIVQVCGCGNLTAERSR
jgi:ABC-type transporter Mla MlaB component